MTTKANSAIANTMSFVSLLLVSIASFLFVQHWW